VVPVLTAVGEVRATLLENTPIAEWSLLLATQGGLPPEATSRFAPPNRAAFDLVA